MARHRGGSEQRQATSRSVHVAAAVEPRSHRAPLACASGAHGSNLNVGRRLLFLALALFIGIPCRGSRSELRSEMCAFVLEDGPEQATTCRDWS